MKNFKIAIFSFVFVLALGLVSAGWFGITGNAAANSCTDSDGGNVPGEAGWVIKPNLFGGSKPNVDICLGSKTKKVYTADGKAIKAYPSLKEFSCDEDKITTTTYDSTEGYCVLEKKEITSADGKTKKGYSVGVWKTLSNQCIGLGNGKVVNQRGEMSVSGCNGNNLTTYSCSEDNTTVIPSVTVCPGKCNGEKRQCTGNCAGDSDSANDPFVSGNLTVDGKLVTDKCNEERKGVVQYACKADGSLDTKTATSCGNLAKCVSDAKGAYCKIDAATQTAINNAVGSSGSGSSGGTTTTTGLTKAEVLTMFSGCTIYSVSNPDPLVEVTGKTICEQRKAGVCLFTVNYANLNRAVNEDVALTGSNAGIINSCAHGPFASDEVVAYCC